MKRSTTALRVLRFFKMLALISFVVSCGSCVACNATTKMELGDEEFYRASGGKIKYGAKAEFSGGQPFRSIGIFSLFVTAISGITAGVIYGRMDEPGKDWDDALYTLTLEQLEKRLVELPNTPGLTDWQITERRKVIIDMVNYRKKGNDV